MAFDTFLTAFEKASYSSVLEAVFAVTVSTASYALLALSFSSLLDDGSYQGL